MSQNPPDDPFGSKPPNDNDPFGNPPPKDPPDSLSDIWSSGAAQPPPPPPPPPPPLPPPQGQYAGPPIGAAKADGAITALVLGILGIVLCPICAPFAWSIGRKAERLVDASGGQLQGRGEATAGKVLGMIGTALIALGILLFVVLIIVGFAVEGSSTTTEF